MRLADFGQVMKQYRTRHGYNQEKMADLLGVQTSKYISMLENSDRKPGPDLQMRMEDLLMADEVGAVLLEQETVVSEEEMAVQVMLFHKLSKIKPVKKEEALKMVCQILDMMAKER